MNEPEWQETDYWWLLRNFNANAGPSVYTRLYKPDYPEYPVWTARFALEHNATVQLDPTLTLQEAMDAAKVLSIARSRQ